MGGRSWAPACDCSACLRLSRQVSQWLWVPLTLDRVHPRDPGPRSPAELTEPGSHRVVLHGISRWACGLQLQVGVPVLSLLCDFGQSNSTLTSPSHLPKKLQKFPLAAGVKTEWDGADAKLSTTSACHPPSGYGWLHAWMGSPPFHPSQRTTPSRLAPPPLSQACSVVPVFLSSTQGHLVGLCQSSPEGEAGGGTWLAGEGWGSCPGCYLNSGGAQRPGRTSLTQVGSDSLLCQLPLTGASVGHLGLQHAWSTRCACSPKPTGPGGREALQ